MKRINDTILEPGDIILTTSTEVVSKAIRMATRSDISHAMVCVEGYSVIDATAEGVQARNTQRLFYEDACSIHVLRLSKGLTDAQLSAVITFMRGHIGTQYSTKEAVQTALGGTRRPSKKQFCSRLVAQAFSHAGIQLVGNVDFCSPGDLKNSPLLAAIDNPAVDISAEEKSRWDKHLDSTEIMRRAINDVLDGARAKNKDIQTFDDIHRHLVEHPEDDDAFCALLERSGYLMLWQIELDKNPWQYDVAVMNAEPSKDFEAYCRTTLRDQENGPHRYIVNRGGYALFRRQFDLRFFGLMAELYQHLAYLHDQRLKTARAWLTMNGHTVPAKPPQLAPHTIEWFASLERWDPPQAMMTRAVVDAAERSDVCSVCGDDPASDYVLEESQRPLGGPGTLRLCLDCFGIRRSMGELYVPMTVE
ncbi:YiiX/YebB-like N1pC/P60 family cysteine hydrolase [Ensifer adhaerens]|uniref:YiiX/YebB-like N1pC/P60 family cysteine hydrolase n=1 Tax=Ensifer adhaerens TaxID=106592 RepID=UPI001319F24D|nr:YiiX/YebB-like N1pC/P60 family cysteine hydrolase [Ensifer adhaerens]